MAARLCWGEPCHLQWCDHICVAWWQSPRATMQPLLIMNTTYQAEVLRCFSHKITCLRIEDSVSGQIRSPGVRSLSQYKAVLQDNAVHIVQPVRAGASTMPAAYFWKAGFYKDDDDSLESLMVSVCLLTTESLWQAISHVACILFLDFSVLLGAILTVIVECQGYYLVIDRGG
eukprot:jgi/Botrbrau1/23116/Bobra.0243s0048.1